MTGQAQRKHLPTRVIRPGDSVDPEAEARAYWARLTPGERFEAAWQLTAELWSWLGVDVNDEQRFPRSAAKLVRR